VLVLRRLAGDRALLAYWRAGFPPQPVALASLPAWAATASLWVLRITTGVPGAALAAAGCLGLVGVVALARRGVALPALLLAFFPLALLAATVRAYPLDGRLVLFMIPVVLLLVAAAIDAVPRKVRGVAVGGWVAALLVGTVAFQPVMLAVRAFPRPMEVSELRPLLEAVRSRWQPGDRVAVETSAEPVYRYYAPRLGLDPAPYVVALRSGRCDSPPVDPALRKARRLWIVLSAWPHSTLAPTAFGTPLVADAQPGEQADLTQLRAVGRPLDVSRAPGAAVWLFQLPATPQPVQEQPAPPCQRLASVKPRAPLDALAA